MICAGRGIESIIQAAAFCKDACLVILGNADSKAYLHKLLKMTGDLRADGKILFHPAVPAKELWKYIGAADVSMMMITPVSKSYYFALPNKFFESIQALTPIIASGLPEMKSLIKRYKIGLICRHNRAEDICRCIRHLCDDKKRYALYKENVKQAKAELCWENEKKILIKAYSNIL